MVRALRMNYAKTFYHILSRGNERRPIFYECKDYLKFLSLLEETVKKFHIEIHAYVLMRNHYHLLVRTKHSNLSRAIQWFGVSYAGWFNRKHNRSGHLFQGRFKSFLIEDERYFAAMCYYIHGNPVRGGIVKEVTEYEWSSGKAYAERRLEPIWLTTELVLGINGGSRRKFCLEQAHYISEGKSPLKDLRHGLYLGSEDFTEQCIRMAEPERNCEKPQLRQILRVRDKKMVAQEILRRLGEHDEEAITVKKKQRPMRDVGIYIMSRTGIYTHMEIGEVFSVGYTAVTGSIKRAEKYFGEHKHLKKLAEKIINDI